MISRVRKRFGDNDEELLRYVKIKLVFIIYITAKTDPSGSAYTFYACAVIIHIYRM